MVQVFRMLCLDRRLPKDWLPREGGVTFIQGLWQETARGGCDITYGDNWWWLQGFGRKLATTWLQSQWDTGYLPKGVTVEQRGDKGRRMDDHWQDSHLSVSPEDRDI